jgi:hypothetical protein
VGNDRSFIVLRTVALIAILCGAVCSLYFVINAGQNNNSLLLRSLFIIWVLSPFVMFFIAISKKWQFATRNFFYWMVIITTIISLLSYSGLIKVPQTKNAFVYLVIPFLLWMFLIIAFIAVRRSSNKISKT